MTNRKHCIKSSCFALIILLTYSIVFLAETQMIQTGKAQVVPTPTPSPSPTSTPTAIPSPTTTPTATPKPTATPTPSPSPTLSNGYVSPTSGTASTNFSYYITYTDPSGSNPSSALVVIDNSPHSMSLYVGTASNGLYQYSTALSVTSHTYYFMFTSGLSGQTALFGLPTQFSGPTMTGPTPSPVLTPGPATLSGGVVNPPIGFTYDTYTFYVNYNDPRGANASSQFVYIDNVRYPMSLSSGSASNGLYSYGTNSLSAGNHTFYFNFISGSSGQNVTLGLPTQIIGPTVTAPTPAPTQAPTPEPTQTSTPTIQPTNPPITPNPTSSPTPNPSPSPTPKHQPTPTQPLIPLPTATPSINPNEAYTNSKNYPLWPIAAAAIIGITLIAILIISRKKSTDPNDEIEF
jgi:hypothetical protein